MQIIQNIREKGAAIVIGVIALSLIGFIMMDAKQGSNRLFSSNNTSVGKINGETIDNNEYSEKVKLFEDRQFGGHASGAQIYQARQAAWDYMVSQKLTSDEFDKLGITFTPKELSSIMFSEDAPADLKQAFSDKSGKYDIQKAQQWWSQQAKKSKGENRDMIINQVIEPMRYQSCYTKYSALVASSAYYPTWLQEKENTDAKTFASISYVSIPYNVISDSTVKVTDDDVLEYMGKHKALFKQDGGRTVSYVAFSTTPSSADTVKASDFVNSKKGEFAVDTNAKVFVARNMSAISFDDEFKPKSKYGNPAVIDSIVKLPNNSVYGPYIDGKNYTIAKLLGSKQLPDSVKARHILIATVDPRTQQPIIEDSVAKKRADSIYEVIKAGGDFTDLAKRFSADEGSKVKGGDLGTFGFGAMVPEFNDFCFNKTTGEKGVVKTQYGYHIIDVQEQKNFNPAYKIAFFAKEILPSEETVNASSTKAIKLAAEARDVKALDEYVKKNGLQKIDVPNVIKENDYQAGALQDARQLVRWAFGANLGEVSPEPFNIGDAYIVAVVTSIQPEGLPSAKIGRPMVEVTIRNQKKAAEIVKKIGATPTLEAAAAAYNIQVATAGADSTITFGSQIINGIGQEPKLIGASFNKALVNKVSEPIEGVNGVYLVKVNNVGTKTTETPELVAQRIEQRKRTLVQQYGYYWNKALKDAADIKDNRSKIY